MRPSLASLAVALAGLASAQTVEVRPPAGLPLRVVAEDFSATRTRESGPATVVDLRGRVTLRNDGTRELRGVVLGVYASRDAAGGRAAVFAPSLRVGPGQTVPIDVAVRLLRPTPGFGEPPAWVEIDGVLREDLSLAGPDRMGAGHKLARLEQRAEQERDRLRRVLATGGERALRDEALGILERQARRPPLETRPAGGERAVSPAARGGREVALACLNLPDAPVELVSGASSAGESWAAAPAVIARNRSRKEIRRFDVGWVVRGPDGDAHLAATAPSGVVAAPSGAVMRLAAGRVFNFSDATGEPFPVQGMSAYVRGVEFADGSMWLPPPDDLRRELDADVEPVSAEQARLAEIYRRDGPRALIAELERLR